MVTKTKTKKSVMKKVSIPKGTDRTLVVNGTPVAFFSHEDISGGKKTVDRSKTYKQKPVPGTNRLIDLVTPALPPGWRISERTGKPYFENRENRSDTPEEIAAFVPKPKKKTTAKKTTAKAKKPAAPKKKPTTEPKTASPKKKPAAPKKPAKPKCISVYNAIDKTTELLPTDDDFGYALDKACRFVGYTDKAYFLKGHCVDAMAEGKRDTIGPYTFIPPRSQSQRRPPKKKRETPAKRTDDPILNKINPYQKPGDFRRF